MALLALACFSAYAGKLHFVSAINPTRTPATGSGDSVLPIISPDGEFVIFASTAKNLVATTNGQPAVASSSNCFNVYLRQRATAATSLLSVNRFGTDGGNGDSIATALSTNSRYLLIESFADDLVDNDTNRTSDLFIRDLQLNSNILVSVALSGEAGNRGAKKGTMTPDGRYVAFVSNSTNLVAGDTNRIPDIFVRDLQLGTTVLVSSNAISPIGYGSDDPQISADGRYVAFSSTATNLLPGVTNRGEIYLHDRTLGHTILASAAAPDVLSETTGESNAVSSNHTLSADGTCVVYAATGPTNFQSAVILRYDVESGNTIVIHTNALRNFMQTLSVTPDGRFVCFVGNLPTVWGNIPSVLVWDATTETVTLASVNAAGTSPAPGESGSISNNVSLGSAGWPAIDSGGRYVSFISTADDLVADFGPGYHCYVRDLQTSNTIAIDIVQPGSAIGVTTTAAPRLSENGRYVAFQSSDSLLIDGDTNQREDLFFRDVELDTAEVVSLRNYALADRTPNKPATVCSVSGDGRYVAYVTAADNLVGNDTNLFKDVFVRDLLFETNILVSVGSNGLPAHGISSEAAISGDGRHVAFTSTATNIVPVHGIRFRNVFVRDLESGEIVLGSVSSNGITGGNSSSHSPMISNDGRHLLFRSYASNLTSGSFVSGTENLFLRNLETGQTVALTTGGATEAMMTPDGLFVVFLGRLSSATATNLYVWDTTASQRVYTNLVSGGVAISPDGGKVAYVFGQQAYVFDRTTKVSTFIGAVVLSRRAPAVAFSANGEFATFCSSVSQVLPDTNNTFDVYLYDLQTNTKTLVSRAYHTAQAASGPSIAPTISYDGRFVAYHSTAMDLVPGDTNGWPDVFLYDRVRATNELISAREGNQGGNNRSMRPLFSGDGHMLCYGSWASDLADDDFNEAGDVFAYTFPYANISRSTGGPPVISWPATAGRNYRVEFKNAVAEPNWQELVSEITIVGHRATTSDSAPNASHRIYRVIAF